MIKNLLKNNLGYTLVEIVTTTAIIGSLTAVAVPNFLRIKMNVNMEIVKQHLKVIGQEMNELYNQTKQFPASIEEIMSGASPEEMSITASLNAHLDGIDNKGYTLDGYHTQANQSTYTFRTCPKEGLENISGDRCYLLDPSGVREIQPWDGTGVDMLILDSSWFSGIILDVLLSDPLLSNAEKANILSGMLMGYGIYASFLNDPRVMGHLMPAEFPSGSGLPSLFVSLSAEDKGAFEQLIEPVAHRLKESGLNVYLSYEENHRLNDFGQSPGYKMAFDFDDIHSVSTQAVTAYTEYVRNAVFTLNDSYYQSISWIPGVFSSILEYNGSLPNASDFQGSIAEYQSGFAQFQGSQSTPGLPDNFFFGSTCYNCHSD
jgi:Tfp pilus assembly protein PilE